MKFCAQVRFVTWTNWLDFGEDLDPDMTSRISYVILHHWEIGPKTIYNTISQKVVDGFEQNLVDRLGVLQERIDSILGEAPDRDVDPRIFQVILHRWVMGIKTI